MQLTGHKTRAVFERYHIVTAGDLSDAARRLDGYLSGQAVTSRAGWASVSVTPRGSNS